MKIYAPVKDANGVYASVRFVNGVGETDNPSLINWFKQHGYKVEGEIAEDINVRNKIEPVIEEPEDEIMGYADPKIPDLDNMNPNQIRDWAKANGYGSIIRNTRSKEKLIELIRG